MKINCGPDGGFLIKFELLPFDDDDDDLEEEEEEENGNTI